MRRAPCVVSVAEHTGWAHLVCVAAPGLVPAVIERRRVTLIDRACRGSRTNTNRQP